MLKRIRNYVALAAFCVMAGCSLFDKPNNAAAFTSDQIIALAVRVESAQDSGIISESNGDQLLTYLLNANSLIGGYSDAAKSIDLCGSTDTDLECIDKVLSHVERAL